MVVATILHHGAVNIDGPTADNASNLTHVATVICPPTSAGVSSLPLDLQDFIGAKHPELKDKLKRMPHEVRRVVVVAVVGAVVCGV